VCVCVCVCVCVGCVCGVCVCVCVRVAIDIVKYTERSLRPLLVKCKATQWRPSKVLFDFKFYGDE